MIEYDARTALIVTDIQNDFADPRGSLYVTGGEEIVAGVNREIEQAHEAEALVVYTQDWHPESTPHFQKDGGIWPVHCVRNTWGAEFCPGLRVEGSVVRKGTGGEDGYSGFTVRAPKSGERYPTELEVILREHRIERLVLVGLATDYCVKETGLDALRKGFQMVVLRDLVRGVNLQPGDDERALAALKQEGARVA
ncbi:MAG: isochorismatase family protein [Chloroflexi bacterium]|nr:isochorismatase family protein [Chloroflexota bacterium]